MNDNPDVCDCGKGRLDPFTGIVTILNRCCAVYFYGDSYGNLVWNEYEAAGLTRVRPVLYISEGEK